MDEPSEGLAPAIVEHLIETFKKLERGGARDPADRAEPRRGDGDRRAPARDGRGLDRRRDDRGRAVAGPGAAAPLPRRRAARRTRGVSGDRRPRSARSTRRAPSTRSCATACASTASTCCSSTRASTSRSASSRTSRATRSRARPAPTSRAGRRGRPRRRRHGDGARRRGGRAAAARRGPARRRSSRSAARAARRSRRAAMRALPVGVPKLMVSTVASGDTRPYVGAVDVTMMYSVVDIAGVNRVSARILANAAGAIAGHGRRDGAAARGRSRSSARRCSASRRRA